MIIYKLTFPNLKSYIGQTTRKMETRLSQHTTQMRAGNPLPVYAAWRKHGTPSVEILGEYLSMQDLHDAERALIASHGTRRPTGYNITVGGDTAPSKEPSVAAKIRAKALGRVVSDEAKAKNALASKANWENPEYRAKVDVAVRAAWTPEMREAASQRLIARMTGTKHSRETIIKIRAKARNMSPETRAKMSASAKARVRVSPPPETRAKFSQKAKEAWANPEITERRVAAIKAATNDPATAQARKDRAAKTWADPVIRAKRLEAIRAANARRKEGQIT